MPNLRQQKVKEIMSMPPKWPLYGDPASHDPWTLIYGEPMTDKYNDPIHLRPNAEDRRILNAIREYLSNLTKQPVFDTAAIRYLLRDWEERQNEKSNQKE